MKEQNAEYMKYIDKLYQQVSDPQQKSAAGDPMGKQEINARPFDLLNLKDDC